MAAAVAARCVDLYLEQRNQASSSSKVDIDSRLAAIVERMFERYAVLLQLGLNCFDLIRLCDIVDSSQTLSFSA